MFEYIPNDNGGYTIVDDGREVGQITPSPGGNNFGAAPQFADYSTLPTPFVNFLDSLRLAQQTGQQNRDIFFQNVSDSRNAALGLLETDVQGIEYALDRLGPRARYEGNVDTEVNIGRAGRIDQFNIGRNPAINAANRLETARNNRFNSQQYQESIETSGIGYRNRIQGVIGRLEERAQGRLPAALDDQFSNYLRNEGSDLARASGIGSTSGAGIRANDRLNVIERLNLATSADAALPGVLGDAQSRLQSPYDRNPTVLTSPTQVPLNISNLEQRIPVISNISAGAAQQALGTQATTLQVVPASQVLTSSLQTEQYNQEAIFRTEKLKLDEEQEQLTATDNFFQGLLNADKGDEVRQESFDAYLEGIKIREQQQNIAALGSAAGGGAAGFIESAATLGTALADIYGSYTGSKNPSSLQGTTGNIPLPSGGSSGSNQPSTGQAPTQPTSGGTSGSGGNTTPASAPGTTPSTSTVYPGGQSVSRGPAYSRFSGGVASPTTTPATPATLEAVSSEKPSMSNIARTAPRNFAPASTYFRGQEQVRMGNATVTPEDYDKIASAGSEFFNSGEVSKRQRTIGRPQNVEGYESESTPESSQAQEVENTNTEIRTQEFTGDVETFSGVYDSVTKPLKDIGLDDQTIKDTIQMFNNWDTATPGEKLEFVGSLGTSILENKGVIDGNTADNIKTVNNAFSILANPNISAEDKTLALGVLGTSAFVPTFTGTLAAPETINGQTVVGSTTTEDGGSAFMLANGDTVSQSFLENGSNTLSAVQAFAVLTSGSATNEQKVAALTSVGIRTAEANELITQVNAGNFTAGLSLFNTAVAWDDMNDIQKTASVIQTSSVVTSAVADTLIANGVTNAGTTLFTSGTATAGGATLSNLGTQTAIEGGGQAIGGSTAGSAGTAGTGATVLAGAGAVAGVVLGIHSAATTLQAIDDMPKSQAEKDGTIGLATAGAAIGAGVGVGASIALGAQAGSYFGPWGAVIGAGVGAVVGLTAANTGSGKNTGQFMRDGWRKGLESAGIAEKNSETGHHEVTLADGTKYDIGLDGGAKLPNVDGGERHTFDVDWSNPVAVETVPDAHVFAIVTGLDPTDSSSHGLFNRAVAQGLNAATSNADTPEAVRENFKALMKDIDPRQAGIRVEVLRQTNKITEEEYNVYLNSINNIFGSQLTASDKQEGHDYLVNMLSGKEDLNKQEHWLLKELTDPKEIQKVLNQRESRIYKDKKNLGEDVEKPKFMQEYESKMMDYYDRREARY